MFGERSPCRRPPGVQHGSSHVIWVSFWVGGTEANLFIQAPDQILDVILPLPGTQGVLLLCGQPSSRVASTSWAAETSTGLRSTHEMLVCGAHRSLGMSLCGHREAVPSGVPPTLWGKLSPGLA